MSERAERPARGRDKATFADDWRRLRGLAGRRRAGAFVRELVSSFGENNLLTYASAISYQVLFALVPLALAGLALLGFLGLGEVWRTDVAPQVKEEVSSAAFRVIDSTAQRILGSQQGFWVTLGAALAAWEVSGAVRASMGALNNVYEAEETRSFRRRMLVSIVLAVGTSACLGLAFAAIQIGDDLASRVSGGVVFDVVAFGLRWLLAVALLSLAIGLLIRFAPARRETAPWVGFAALLVVVSWIAASLVFGWYVTSVASYSSVFGSLAVVIVLMTYLYISSIVFLVGVQVDSLLRQVAAGRPRSDWRGKAVG